MGDHRRNRDDHYGQCDCTRRQVDAGILGEVNSPKSLLALEWCIARKIETPLVIHGENVVEINSYVTQLGVQIHDRNAERRIVYVANPRANDALRKIIDACA